MTLYLGTFVICYKFTVSHRRKIWVDLILEGPKGMLTPLSPAPPPSKIIGGGGALIPLFYACDLIFQNYRMRV